MKYPGPKPNQQIVLSKEASVWSLPLAATPASCHADESSGGKKEAQTRFCGLFFVDWIKPK